MIAAILAAGKSERFGSCKMLAQVNGKPMIQHVIDAVPESLDEIVVVTGAFHDEIKRLLSGQEITVLYNKHYANGMATSVKAAARFAIEKKEDLLLTLGDLPFVTTEDYGKLLAEFDGDVIFSRFNRSYGPPALFGTDQLGKLFDLQGDKGAKSKFPIAKTVDIPSAGKDVDQLTDLN